MKPGFAPPTSLLSCPGRGSTLVRIELLETGRFRLDGERPGAHLLPSSPCVLDLLRRHTAADSVVGRAEVVLLDGGRETPLVLRRPLYRNGTGVTEAPLSTQNSLCVGRTKCRMASSRAQSQTLPQGLSVRPLNRPRPRTGPLSRM